MGHSEGLNSNQIESITFQPGQFLFHENEHGYHFFIIQEGQVEVFKMGTNGIKVPLAIVEAGTALGELAMIDRLPRSASAVAITTVHAARVSAAAYQQLLQDLPEWAVSVLKALVDRLRHTNEIVRRSGVVDAKVRHAIEQLEYDPDGNTICDESPLLNSDE